MIRAVLYALITIVAITFLRMVMGIISKGFSDLVSSNPSGSGKSAKQDVPTTGTLKPCARCGTYVVASQALTVTSQGQTAYYCSQKCKEAAVA